LEQDLSTTSLSTLRQSFWLCNLFLLRIETSLNSIDLPSFYVLYAYFLG